MSVSIVIPTFNEEALVEAQIRRCLELDPRPEVIVADGESHDGSLAKARAAGAFALACPGRGRALQMNAGAAVASGEILVFLHADVLLPQVAYSAMLEALCDPGVAGGAFRRRFDSPSLLLRAGCRLADLRGRFLGIFLGDQAQFVRTEVFRRLGGFPEMLLFEDLAFSMMLSRHGATRLVRERVIASPRRFHREGNLRRLARNAWLTLLYLSGVDANRLARRYYPELFPAPQARPDRPISDEKAAGGGT
jgi:rSAM/selenodomain-associated transferase 2